jgi:hypothetical protein
MPVAAFGLKQYLDRCGPVSKTSDNEHALASLGDAEELRVQHSVGEPIPELAQRPEDGTHCSPVGWHATAVAGTAFDAVGNIGEPSGDFFLPGEGDSAPFSAFHSASVCGAGVITWAGADRRQETGDVLKNDPLWAQFVGQPHDVPEQSRACAAQARAASCDGEVLAGKASGDDASPGNKSS